VGILVVAAGIIGWQAKVLHDYAHLPTARQEPHQIFSIAAGESFGSVSARLEALGLIKEKTRFKLLARITGSDKALKAGESRLSAGMTPLQILDALVSGKAHLYRLTIPEGYNLDQIAEAVERQGLGSKAAFMQFAANPATAQSFHIAAETLEGYLFPDTYLFPKGISAESVVAKMVKRFEDQFLPEWQMRAKELKLSVHEVVTLASIIEKETGEASERPIISSVFHNRLKKNMRLESDPTVIYGIENFDGNITRKHLKTATPYNTYVIRGLPPGPIANPGSASILAALYPAETDFLFFVSKKDRTHQFSTTIDEHNAAVRKYQLKRRRKPTS
jgi:UPF0755 protein